MAGLAIRWVLNAFALWVVSVIVPGIRAESVFATFVAALVLGILNALLRPVLLVLTLPINLLTLGLFTFVVNAVMLELTAAIVSGFVVAGFGSALLGALVLSVVSFALNVFVSDAGRIGYVHIEMVRSGPDRWSPR
jgi:putative membrane protein